MSDPGGGRRPKAVVNAILKRDVGVQTTSVENVKSGSGRGRCCYCLLWMSAVFVAVVAAYPYWLPTAEDLLDKIFFPNDFVVGPALMQDLGMEGVSLFKQHDRDDDGYLSLEEFEPIAHRILQTNETFTYEEPIEEWQEVVTIEANFEPLLLETMSKSKDEMDDPPPLDPLRGLRYWKNPVRDWSNIAANHLLPFLSPDPHVVESVGEVYELVKVYAEDNSHPALSSNRYLPPQLYGNAEKMLHRLLTILHPRPFVYTRFGPQGAVATVRAKNKKYVDIAFRIHAEFQLNEPPFQPFWFTPAQFTGRVIISKDGSRVLAFEMYVPKDKRLNVDMEWLTGGKEENMEVDIGYMPKMSLRATRTSMSAFLDGDDLREVYLSTPEGYAESLEQIAWDEEITMEEAKIKLEQELYPFKKVTYYNLTTAHSLAQSSPDLLVHSILLWGALDDQSC